MNLDIHSAIVTIIVITILGAIFSIWRGAIAFRKGNKVSYFRLKRIQMAAGWRAFIFGVVLVGFALLMGRFGEPVSYNFFPPSPTRTRTPTITTTPTITFTPTISQTFTITPTLAVSYTPTPTGTPFLPIAIESQFNSIVTPNSAAKFSPLVFSLKVNNYIAVEPQTVFQNPLNSVYVTYSYDGMTDGVQWTEIWYLNGKILNYSTSLWDSGTGGSGQDELIFPTELWAPGIYQLVFFVGSEWKALGEFRVMGSPPTATMTPSPSATGAPTTTSSATHTHVPSATPRPTDTHWPSPTQSK
jgi:hypothetical protein